MSVARTGSVLLGVCVVVFALRFLSGDPVGLYAPLDATPEEFDAIRHAYGFDRSVPQQFVDFIGGLLHGDFGTSLRSGRPALEVVLERLPATATLTFWAFVPSAVGGVALGIFAAATRSVIVDRITMSISLLGVSIPVYWAGTGAILLFAVWLPVFPTGGSSGWLSLVLPAATLGMAVFARAAKMARAAVADQLQQPYVQTARAKGAGPLRVLLRHALRNALAPIITLLGLDLGVLVGGAVLTESIFAWPGVGRLAVQSIEQQDFAVVQAVILLVAFGYITIFKILDALYVALDPRLRSEVM